MARSSLVVYLVLVVALGFLAVGAAAYRNYSAPAFQGVVYLSEDHCTDQCVVEGTIETDWLGDMHVVADNGVTLALPVGSWQRIEIPNAGPQR